MHVSLRSLVVYMRKRIPSTPMKRLVTCIHLSTIVCTYQNKSFNEIR